MSCNLYLNGFVIKGCYDTNLTQSDNGYRGIGKYTSWPLEDHNDEQSINLTNEAFNKWFCYQNTLEVVPDKEYLQRYLEYCKKIGISVILLQLETLDEIQLANFVPEIVETLGYDCIGNVNYSFLYDDTDFLKESMISQGLHLNANGLFENIDDVFKYIVIRRSAIANGANLEDYYTEIPARISIVML